MLKKINFDNIKTIFFFSSWIFLIVFLVLFFKIIQDYKISSKSFKLNSAAVIFSNGVELNNKDAFNYLSIKEGDSIFKIDPEEKIKNIFKKHPEVLKLSLYKQMPDKITAYATNRTPIAQVHLGRYYPIDSEGFVLPFPSNFRIELLPLIKGIKPGEVAVASDSDNIKIDTALELLDLARVVLNKIKLNFDIDVSNIDNINLISVDDIKIKLGKNKFHDKLIRLKLVLADIEAKNLNPAIIDLRFDKAVLTPR